MEDIPLRLIRSTNFLFLVVFISIWSKTYMYEWRNNKAILRDLIYGIHTHITANYNKFEYKMLSTNISGQKKKKISKKDEKSIYGFVYMCISIGIDSNHNNIKFAEP